MSSCCQDDSVSLNSVNDSYREIYAFESPSFVKDSDEHLPPVFDCTSQSTLFEYSPSAFNSPVATCASLNDLDVVKPEPGQKALPTIFQEALRTCEPVTSPICGDLATGSARLPELSSVSSPTLNVSPAREVPLTHRDVTRVRHASESQICTHRVAMQSDVMMSAAAPACDSLDSSDVFGWKAALRRSDVTDKTNHCGKANFYRVS